MEELQNVLEEKLLFVPAWFASDLSQIQLGDKAAVSGGKEENVLLNGRRYVQQCQQLRQTSWRNMTQESQRPVIGHRARAD